MITPERLASSGSESGNQKALFCWAKQNEHLYPQLKWLFAVPNGFYSTAAQKAKMKAEGLKDGVPDVLFPVYSGWKIRTGLIYYGLAIEMKVKNNKINEKQDEWLYHFKLINWFCAVCYSWGEARDVILNYLKD